MKKIPKINIIKLVFASGIGNFVEWYTFIIYAYLTPTISQLFFPSKSINTSMIFSLLVFSAGFLSRPLGAIIFGYMGDKLGRQKTLVISQTTMLFSTLLMCFLPTYSEIGYYAPFLLTLLRIFQGLSVSGEYTTSLCYLAEASEQKERGRWVSTVPASTAFGILFSALFIFIFTEIISKQNLLTWGWRFCFFIGVIFSLIGIYLRLILPETNMFLMAHEKMVRKHISIKDLFFKMSILKSMLAVIFLVTAYAYFYQLLFIWVPIMTLMKQHNSSLAINSIAMAIFMISILLGGILSDAYKHRKIMLISMVIIILTNIPILYFVKNFDNIFSLLLFLSFFSIVFGLYVGSASTYFSEIYPIEIRSLALSVSYNIPYAIFGGLTPVILTDLAYHSVLYTAYTTTGIFTCALIALIAFEKQPLSGSLRS